MWLTAWRGPRAGRLKLTNANDAVTMAAAQPSNVYVSGATANASMLTQSIQGTFICDAGCERSLRSFLPLHRNMFV
jgi:hypothetical protein